MWYDGGVARSVGVDFDTDSVDCRNVGLNNGIGGDEGVSDDASWQCQWQHLAIDDSVNGSKGIDSGIPGAVYGGRTAVGGNGEGVDSDVVTLTQMMVWCWCTVWC